MVDREQDLSKKPGESFFQFSLPEIYGRYIHPPGTQFPIAWATYKSLTYGDKVEVAAAKQAVIGQLGIPSIAAWGTGGSDKCVVLAGSTEPLGFWVPQQAERSLLIALASGLASGKDRPVILEVDAGTVIISKTLAAESRARVIGVEPDGTKLFSLAPTSGDITLRQGTVWDVLPQLGPKYPDELIGEVYGNLDALQRYQQAMAPMIKDMSDGERIALNRMRHLAKVAMHRMQLLAPQYAEESPVDMVIQSVGESPFTTVAIRDGIQPKAIVCVRQVPGLQPIPDDWRERYNESRIKRNAFDLYDPGENYLTVAVWRTFSRKYWESHMYDLSRTTPQMQTEVLVQLRRNVQVKDLPGGASPQYLFDHQVLEVLSKYGQADDFQAGIRTAREQLLAA